MIAGLAWMMALALGVSSEPGPARVCIVGHECREMICDEPVPPSTEPRPYTVLDSTGAYNLGVLEPGATAVACTSAGELILTTAPTKVRALITSERTGAWIVDLDARARITAPRGDYLLTVEAPHFIRLRRAFRLDESPLHLSVDLQPMPTLFGVVRNGAGTVVRIAEETVTVADGTGRFELEADPERWPAEIEIVADGFSSTVVPVPRMRASADLGTIELRAAGVIAVVVQRRDPTIALDLDVVELLQRERKLGRTVGTRRVDGAMTTVRFEGIAAGSYVVVARGLGPGERRVEPVIVAAGSESTVTMPIDPFELRIATKLDGEIIAPSEVMIEHRDAFWSAAVMTDERGEAGVVLWQGGRYKAKVRGANVASWIDRRDIVEGVPTRWLLDLPGREITGVVLDADSSEPVALATVWLEVERPGESALGVSLQADEKGRFRFRPAAYGAHTLTAAADGYAPVETRYRFEEPEQRRAVTIRLDAGATRAITVSDARGVPIVDAAVMDYRGSIRAGYTRTSASGSATLLVPRGETRDVWIIPRDESLGFAPIGATDEPVRIPAGNCRIVVEVRTDSDAPIPWVPLTIAHQGRVLPIEVKAALHARGSRTIAGPDGRFILEHMPAGAYEIGIAGQPAVRLMAVPGETVARITIAAK